MWEGLWGNPNSEPVLGAVGIHDCIIWSRARCRIHFVPGGGEPATEECDKRGEEPAETQASRTPKEEGYEFAYKVPDATRTATGAGPPSDSEVFLCCDFLTKRDNKCTIHTSAWPKILDKKNCPLEEKPEGVVKIDCEAL